MEWWFPGAGEGRENCLLGTDFQFGEVIKFWRRILSGDGLAASSLSWLRLHSISSSVLLVSTL